MAKVVDYVVKVKTSDRFGAATRAKVFLQMCGQNGKMGEVQLANSDKPEAFRRNQLDTFVLKNAKNLGKLSTVRLRHDNSGSGPDWHVEFVDVIDPANRLSYHFPCHRWLSKNEEDGRISRTLKCTLVEKGQATSQQTATGVPRSTLRPPYPDPPATTAASTAAAAADRTSVPAAVSPAVQTRPQPQPMPTKPREQFVLAPAPGSAQQPQFHPRQPPPEPRSQYVYTPSMQPQFALQHQQQYTTSFTSAPVAGNEITVYGQRPGVGSALPYPVTNQFNDYYNMPPPALPMDFGIPQQEWMMQPEATFPTPQYPIPPEAMSPPPMFPLCMDAPDDDVFAWQRWNPHLNPCSPFASAYPTGFGFPAGSDSS